MKVATDIISAVSEAISEGFKLVGLILRGREKADAESAIQAGEQYIFVDERSGKYEEISESKRIKLKKHYRKIFFKKN